MGLTPPIRERPWRTLAAVVAAPASLAPATLLLYLDWLDEGQGSAFFPWNFLLAVAVGYVASAVVGGIASVLRLCFRAPLRAGVVVALFALSAGAWSLLGGGSLTEYLFTTGFLAALSLPVSITYCAIAGIRWR